MSASPSVPTFTPSVELYGHTTQGARYKRNYPPFPRRYRCVIALPPTRPNQRMDPTGRGSQLSRPQHDRLSWRMVPTRAAAPQFTRGR